MCMNMYTCTSWYIIGDSISRIHDALLIYSFTIISAPCTLYFQDFSVHCFVKFLYYFLSSAYKENICAFQTLLLIFFQRVLIRKKNICAFSLLLTKKCIIRQFCQKCTYILNKLRFYPALSRLFAVKKYFTIL